jgi:ABC-2 type transport system ATP-binding protein
MSGDNLNNTIVVKNLSKDYGDHKAVKEISFNIKKGTIFGFLGPNGAGKSTTIKMLTCQLKPTSGQGYINGYDITKNEIDIKKKIGVVFESQNLYEDFTVVENLDFFRRLYGSPKEKINEVLQMVGMEEYKKDKIKTFSKGMKQKILISRALLNDPEILFLDEPSSGLDPHSAREIRQQILKFKEQGKTILLTTHNMEEADLLCDSLAIIHKGIIVIQDTPQNLKKKYGENIVKIETLSGECYETPLNTRESIDVFDKLSSEKQILTIRSKEATMEEVFVRLTGEEWLNEF